MIPDLQRSARRVVGVRQVLRALDAGRVAKAYVALDADAAITAPVRDKCLQTGVPCEEVADMRILGEMCAIAVGAACAGLLHKEDN